MGDKRIVRRAGLAVLATMLGSLIGWWLSSARLDRSARTYAEASVSQILNAWSEQELLQRASVPFRDAVAPDELHAGFGVLAHRLGMMRSCSGAQGNLQQKRGKAVTALYDVPCQFDHGAATIRIALIRVDGDWQILGFRVDSPALNHGRTAPGGLQAYPGEQT